MLNGPIPPHVDPRKLVERAATLEGVLPIAKMARLSEQLTSSDGDVHAKFSFFRDQQKLAVMHVELNGEVSMVCQRCLEPAKFHVGGAYDYVIIPEGKSIDDLPSGYDALEMGDDPIDLTSLAEDELLLALPIVPVHDPEDCQQPVGYATAPEPSENVEERPNPFSVLAQLKRDPNV
ncbi:metal-binding protein [Pseudomonas nitroreducens]|uniref:Large ribosomal RNA subunit accumulation protein YceD n=1 Tax=Pseudomonas nitroreducens TaxID=46680 RepID=A0A5R9A083_PSENT|nr:YceD family protein [Pseudomonas nitroreducens]TLP72042.1 metal-binding protein [Pseudomonas nitroreducens]